MMSMSAVGPYYSQFREDRLLERMFADQRGGVCLDVGANDGITGSNSYFLEQRGWRCILVEPVPELCDRIRRFRRGIVVNCAASSRRGNASFYVAQSLDSWSALDLTDAGKERLPSGERAVQTITVQTRTLDEILDTVGVSAVDVASIDVEGHELLVLEGFSLRRFAPRVLIIEDNSGGSDQAVASRLATEGYVRFLRTGVNDWYGRETEPLFQPDSLAAWKTLLRRWEFEDRVKRRCAFLNGILPGAVRKLLAHILAHVARFIL